MELILIKKPVLLFLSSFKALKLSLFLNPWTGRRPVVAREYNKVLTGHNGRKPNKLNLNVSNLLSFGDFGIEVRCQNVIPYVNTSAYKFHKT